MEINKKAAAMRKRLLQLSCMQRPMQMEYAASGAGARGRQGGDGMEYHKKADLKVECIASQEDLDFFGVTFDDILDRTPQGMHFLKKAKELCAMTQKVEWTNVAYTLNITMLPGSRVSFEFSECIADYIAGLKHSLVMADSKTRGPIEDFIRTLEHSGEEDGRRLIAHFEQNVKDVKKEQETAKDENRH